MKGERGFALVLTLIVTALLVALTAEFVNEVYVDTSARQNFVDGQQASLLAESGIEAGRKLLQLGLARTDKDYTSLADLDFLAKMLSFEDETGKLQVTLEEESGKLNLNAVVNQENIYRPIANSLFEKLGLQPELLDAAADWIDTNNEPRSGGAETPYYQTLKPPYGAKNGNLLTFEELRLIKGFDAKTLERLRPYITAYPDDPNPSNTTAPINVNTAPKELIASLDDKITDDLTQQIIEERRTKPFTTPADLGDRVSGMKAISLDLASKSKIMQKEKGAVYRILSQATVNETARVIEAVVRPGGQPPILYWREY